MIMIGDMLGVAPEDRDMLLRWSDDLIARHVGDRAARGAARRAAQAFEEYAAYNRARGRRPARKRPRDDLMSVLVHAEIDGERLDDDELLQESAADPGRRRRDHAPRDHRRHGAADPQPRRSAASCSTIRADPDRGRGDAALGDADPEHEPHGDARRRAARPDDPRGRQAAAALPVGQPRRARVRRPVRASTSSAQPEPPRRLRRLRRALLPGRQPGAPRAARDVRGAAARACRTSSSRATRRCRCGRRTSSSASSRCRSCSRPARLGGDDEMSATVGNPKLRFWFEFASTYSYPARDARRGASRARPASTLGGGRSCSGRSSPRRAGTTRRSTSTRSRAATCGATSSGSARGAASRSGARRVFPRNGLLAARVALSSATPAGAGLHARRLPRELRRGPRHRRRERRSARSSRRSARPPADVLRARSRRRTRSGSAGQTEEATALGIFGAPSFVAATSSSGATTASRTRSSGAHLNDEGPLTLDQRVGCRCCSFRPRLEDDVAPSNWEDRQRRADQPHRLWRAPR